LKQMKRGMNMNQPSMTRRSWTDQVQAALHAAGATIQLLPCGRVRVSNYSDFLTVNSLADLKQFDIDRLTHDTA
jgi:hypothetical protein